MGIYFTSVMYVFNNVCIIIIIIISIIIIIFTWIHFTH